MGKSQSDGIAQSIRQATGQTFKKLDSDKSNMSSNRMAYSEDSSGFLPGLIVGGVIGALVGAAAALWFAPQSGEQTQMKLKESAAKLKEQADEALHDARSSVQQASHVAREKAESVVQQGQNMVYEQAQKASRTAENMVDAAERRK